MLDIAVITGGSSGIGNEISLQLSNHYQVVIVDIDLDGLNRTKSEIEKRGNEASIFCGDVSKRETLVSARKLAESKGKLISWVNCAGITNTAPLHNFPNKSEYLTRIIEVNQIGTFWGCVEAVSSFIDNQVTGSIVNISSVHGRQSAPGHAVYEMTKSAIEALTRNVAVTYAPYGIRANAVSPGAIMSPSLERSFSEKVGGGHRRELLQNLSPMNRIGEAIEVANVVKFLLSSDASYLTGQNIAIDGGWTSSLVDIKKDPSIFKKIEETK
jgi:NAD(P)-dependent dehydrogenase (short-subunit alcohol dehydrogenase family)